MRRICGQVAEGTPGSTGQIQLLVPTVHHLPTVLLFTLIIHIDCPFNTVLSTQQLPEEGMTPVLYKLGNLEFKKIK